MFIFFLLLVIKLAVKTIKANLAKSEVVKIKSKAKKLSENIYDTIPVIYSSNKINGKRSHNQANQESISQKLDKTGKLLDTKTQSNKTSKKNKDDLIKHALEVQKSQSKLLDNLDEKTRKRMKTMALQLMIFKKRG